MPLFITPNLDRLWPEWLIKFEIFKSNFSETIAVPFWSAADGKYLESEQRFLMVGQATKGPFVASTDFAALLHKSPMSALRNQKGFNRRFMIDHPKRSAFWRALVKGAEFCGEQERYKNVVWTNLAKIGFEEKNVNSKLFEAQKELAEQTLRAELADYNPTLVHFATGALGGQCILGATGTLERDWHRLPDDGNQDVWFLEAEKRSMIWTRHPNRARPSLVQAWNLKLEELARRRAVA